MRRLLQSNILGSEWLMRNEERHLSAIVSR